MADMLTPRLDVERGPVLWGAAVTAVCGTLALLAFQRPGWLFPASILGGAVAALRGSYYSQSSANGLVGVGLGIVLLFPAVAGFRALYFFAFPGVEWGLGDLFFLSFVGWFSLIIIRGPIMLLFGYLGGLAAGKLQSAPERSIRRSERGS